MLRPFFFILFVITGASSYGQSDIFLRNLVSRELKLFMHKDSIENLYEIRDAFAIDNEDTIIFPDSILFFNISYYYPHKFKSYLLYDSQSDSGLYITLDFFKDRLFRINILATKSLFAENIKLEIQKYSSEHDTLISNDKFLIYGELQKPFSLALLEKSVQFFYHENLSYNFSTFYLEDKKFANLIPSWCGFGRSRKTWARLEKYVARQID